MEIKSTTTILDLNMDVLDIIFSNIYWEKDKFNFAKSHPHFSAAYVYHNPKKYKDIDFYDLSKDWPFILEWFGSSVLILRDKSGVYDNVNQTNVMLELAAKYCPNVETIEFLLSSENVKIVEDNLVELKNLKYIKLNIKPPLINVENIVQTLNQLQKLRRLALRNWSIGYLEPMNNLQNIEYLELSNLYEEDIKILSNLLKNLKCLKTGADLKTLNILSKHCKKLEYLRLPYYNDVDSPMLPHFPKLKRLKIFGCDEYDDDGSYLKTLHGNYNNQLEVLNIPRGKIGTAKTARRISKLKAVKILSCFSIKSRSIRYIAHMLLEKLMLSVIEVDDLLVLLQECKTLRWLHLDKYTNLNKDNLDTLLDVLKSNGFQPEKRFVLHLYDHRLCVSLRNMLTTCPNGKLLNVQDTIYYFSSRYWNNYSRPSSCSSLNIL